MKTYVIILSRVFPATHCKAGEQTGFCDKLRSAVLNDFNKWMKRHTIRSNYDLWKKLFDEIAAGNACLSVRQWNGKPYRSKQTELMRLTRDDGIGIQKLSFHSGNIECPVVDNAHHQPTDRLLAHNDGLSAPDWFDWFRGYDLSKPLAIIHFTSYRY